MKKYSIDDWLDYELYKDGAIDIGLRNNHDMIEKLQVEITNHTKQMNSYSMASVARYHLSKVNAAKNALRIYAKERDEIKDQIEVSIEWH